MAWCLLLLSLPAAYFALQFETDNAAARWIRFHEGSAAQYDDFRARFGSDDFVIAALSGKPLFDPAALDVMVIALENLRAIEGVQNVLGLPAVYLDQFSGEDPEALEVEFTSTPFYRGLFISNDAKVAGLLIEVELPDSSSNRETLVRNIKDAMAPLRSYGFRVDLIGPPILTEELDSLSERAAVRTFIIAFAISLVTLSVLLRSPRAIFIAAAGGLCTVVITLGAIVAMGFTLSLVSGLLPPMLWVLSIAHSVHILARYEHHRADGQSIDLAIDSAMNDTALACTLSAVTTAAGFFSFIVASMPAVVEMGLFAAGGCILALMVNLSVTPVLIRLFRLPGSKRGSHFMTEPAQSLAAMAMRRPRLTFMVFSVVALIGAVNAARLVPEPEPLSYFSPDAPIIASYHFVDTHLTGHHSLEIVVTCPGGWLNPTFLQAIENLESKLAANASVARVLSPLDLLRKLNHWGHGFDPAAYVLPVSAQAAETLIRELPDTARTDLQRFVDRDGEHIRVTLIPRVIGAVAFRQLLQETDAAMAALPEPMTAYRTGIVSLIDQVQKDLTRTQMRTFVLAFLVVFVVIGIGMRSVVLMAVSIPPNVIPVMVVFAIMPIAGIRLDVGTVLVAGVAMGISVDDTVHFLNAYRRRQRAGDTPELAVRNTIRDVGAALVITSVTVCAGFAALLTSDFVPLRYYGTLSLLAMATALIADLTLVPAILTFRRQRAASR